MNPKDQKIQQLELEVKKLTSLVAQVGRRIEFLERENRRRGQEINQILSHLRKN